MEASVFYFLGGDVPSFLLDYIDHTDQGWIRIERDYMRV